MNSSPVTHLMTFRQRPGVTYQISASSSRNFFMANGHLQNSTDTNFRGIAEYESYLS